MTKLLGSLLILSGGLLGLWRQLADSRRSRRALSDLLRALGRLGEEIRMTRRPLPQLLEGVAAECGPEAGAFFQAAAGAARRGEGLGGAWRQGAEALPIRQEDRSALAALGAELHGDEEMVRRALEQTVRRLEKSAAAAEQRRLPEEKRVSALWLSAAALLVILLI